MKRILNTKRLAANGTRASAEYLFSAPTNFVVSSSLHFRSREFYRCKTYRKRSLTEGGIRATTRYRSLLPPT